MTESLGSKYCVLGTRVCMQRTAFFWLGIPVNDLVVSQTTTGPQARSVLILVRTDGTFEVLVFPPPTPALWQF